MSQEYLVTMLRALTIVVSQQSLTPHDLSPSWITNTLNSFDLSSSLAHKISLL